MLIWFYVLFHQNYNSKLHRKLCVALIFKGRRIFNPKPVAGGEIFIEHRPRISSTCQVCEVNELVTQLTTHRISPPDGAKHERSTHRWITIWMLVTQWPDIICKSSSCYLTASTMKTSISLQKISFASSKSAMNLSTALYITYPSFFIPIGWIYIQLSSRKYILQYQQPLGFDGLKHRLWRYWRADQRQQCRPIATTYTFDGLTSGWKSLAI